MGSCHVDVSQRRNVTTVMSSHFALVARQQNVEMDRVEIFETEQARLGRIATRILGSETDADDVLQEARLRLNRTDNIDDIPAWLTTVVTRLCLDHLRKQQTRDTFEAATSFGRETVDPEADALLAERVGDALHVVLETLAPTERAAFVLHDVFGYQFDEISVILGRSATATRQLASRARRKVHNLPEPEAERSSRAESRRVVDAFLAAARGGDLEMLLSLLAPDVVMRADLVGQSIGSDALYDGAAAVAARLNYAKGAAPVFIDGERNAAWIAAGTVKVAFVFHVDAGLIREVELIADPEILASMTITRSRNPFHSPTKEVN
jgi:RNA polymerase sigma factor (sigma-70 family)